MTIHVFARSSRLKVGIHSRSLGDSSQLSSVVPVSEFERWRLGIVLTVSECGEYECIDTALFGGGDPYGKYHADMAAHDGKVH